MPPQLEPTDAPQGELFELSQFEGYGQLGEKERLFVQALCEGCTQLQAIERAGVEGNDEYLSAAASKLVRTGKVQRILRQAWSKSGASLDATLRQAAQVQERSFEEWKAAETTKERKFAFVQWLKTSQLLAAIHARIKVDFAATANPNHVILDNKLQERLLAARRQVVVPLVNDRTGGN